MADAITALSTLSLGPDVLRQADGLSLHGPRTIFPGPAKIRKAAQDFESVLLTHWLEQAQESLASVPGGDGDDDDGTRSQFEAIGMQAVATAVTQAGGIGIAAMIAGQLRRQTLPEQTPPVPANGMVHPLGPHKTAGPSQESDGND